MNHRRFVRDLAVAAALVLAFVAPAAAGGDTVVPQIADASGIVRTKLDIQNLSSSEPITRLKIFFYRQEGTPWVLDTNLGSGSEFRLDLGRNQVMRVETLGRSGGPISGYAVLRDTEGNGSGVADFRIAVSIYYEVLDGSRVTDTVSVPVGQPTVRWSFPVEGDVARQIYSGLAIVNLSDVSNTVTLKLWSAFPPFASDASDGGTATLTLGAREQRARFLGEAGLFPERSAFKGVLVGSAERPVAVVGLLQTATAGGVQYATLAPEYRDALGREASVYLPDGLRLDADGPRVPYLTLGDDGSFDLHYQFISSTVRKLAPVGGATLAPLGRLSATEFDNLTREDLLARTYSTVAVDADDFSGNLVAGYSIALRTSVGRYAKVRIVQIVTSGSSKDLVLDVLVYR